MSALLLWLEGPLQSWGTDSRFGNRTTLPFPSRSGVMGLLCCASGRGGEQEDWLAHMATFPLKVKAYARSDGKGPRRSPLLRDFHMVGSGYDTDDPWQNLLVPKTIEGKKPVGAGTKLTYRHYLQDMAFACVLSLPEEEAQALDRDLAAPVWEICLGRKNCVPCERVGRGVFPDEEAALEEAKKIATCKERELLFTVTEEIPEGSTDDVLTLNDVPVRFGIRKVYRSRLVRLVPPPDDSDEEPDEEAAAETGESGTNEEAVQENGVE